MGILHHEDNLLLRSVHRMPGTLRNAFPSRISPLMEVIPRLPATSCRVPFLFLRGPNGEVGNFMQYLSIFAGGTLCCAGRVLGQEPNILLDVYKD